jgi:hypothetical protein
MAGAPGASMLFRLKRAIDRNRAEDAAFMA